MPLSPGETFKLKVVEVGSLGMPLGVGGEWMGGWEDGRMESLKHMVLG